MSEQEENWLLQEKYQGVKTVDFLADCERLKAGEPLAYIIGQIPFLGCSIYLDSKPLIPRVETEFWVEQLIKEIKKTKSNYPLKILDLCAGSGCIGVAIAKSFPDAFIDFIELDSRHISTIKKNCHENNIAKDQIRIIASDLFNNAEESITYDYIISNPPYIDPALDRTQISVKNFEPALALYGGADGLELIKDIIKGAPNYLREKGELWLEHEPEQAQAIHELGDPSFTVTTFKDQYQVDRFSRLVLK